MLSIIIPVYNCSRYIRACLDSLLDSDLPKGSYEIIAVDDGSTDDSWQILQEYAKNHDHLTIITQPNAGQSVARNNAIGLAQGEYIWFIDGDDLTDGKLIRVYKTIQRHNHPDVVAIELKECTEQMRELGNTCTQPDLPKNLLMSGRDAVVKGYNPSSVCALFIKKTLLEERNLRHVPGIANQDVELSYRVMSYARQVIFTPLAPYLYIQHPQSTRNNTDVAKKSKYLKSMLVVAMSFKDFSRNFEKSDPQLARVLVNRSQNIIWGLVYTLFQNRKQWKANGINKIVIEEMKSKGLYPLKGPFDKWKKSLFVRLMNIESFIA